MTKIASPNVFSTIAPPIRLPSKIAKKVRASMLPVTLGRSLLDSVRAGQLNLAGPKNALWMPSKVSALSNTYTLPNNNPAQASDAQPISRLLTRIKTVRRSFWATHRPARVENTKNGRMNKPEAALVHRLAGPGYWINPKPIMTRMACLTKLSLAAPSVCRVKKVGLCTGSYSVILKGS